MSDTEFDVGIYELYVTSFRVPAKDYKEAVAKVLADQEVFEQIDRQLVCFEGDIGLSADDDPELAKYLHDLEMMEWDAGTGDVIPGIAHVNEMIPPAECV